MNAQRIAVLTDSGTDTPDWFCTEHDVRVVPLKINFADGTTYRAGVDISSEELIERFACEIPTTSLPSPDDIRQAIEQTKADGYTSAVFVTISSGLSATFQTAQLVASQVEDFDVLVVDTKSIGAAAGMVVMAATRMIEAGIPFDELQGRLDALSEKTKVFFCVKELSYLHKGGRIDDFTYHIGSILNIKPIIWCDEEGYYRTFKKARGWERALTQEVGCIAELAEHYQKVNIAVACTAACDMFDELEEAIHDKIDNVADIVRAGISPALLVHTGPELVGMAIQPAWETSD